MAEARAGRFDALAVHAELIAAGYTALEADMLVQEVMRAALTKCATDTDLSKS